MLCCQVPRSLNPTLQSSSLAIATERLHRRAAKEGKSAAMKAGLLQQARAAAASCRSHEGLPHNYIFTPPTRHTLQESRRCIVPLTPLPANAPDSATGIGSSGGSAREHDLWAEV